jgi:hypothetical protein
MDDFTKKFIPISKVFCLLSPAEYIQSTRFQVLAGDEYQINLPQFHGFPPVINLYSNITDRLKPG